MSSDADHDGTVVQPCLPQPRFESGELVATPGALDVLEHLGISPFDLLHRHIRGDWGDVCAEDAKANEDALRSGSRLLSAYELPTPAADSPATGSVKLWLISEADRSVTTILLPEEY
ncbi:MULTISPECIES: hypothetical protein [Methylomonas]|uniref:Type I restriction endonuclease subunit M n=1 Tax=Methylomonas koyamae TaxID=702114 RepID=A0A177P7R9_9GAMM|nr:hypothetical protein [Methylomonas koyamae]OAI26387.1 type I restriction endonuclease subunit M [Methylomonas koyamae]